MLVQDVTHLESSWVYHFRWYNEWHAADDRIEPKCQKIVQRWLEGNGKPVKRRIVLEAIQEVHPILVDLKTCIM